VATQADTTVLGTVVVQYEFSVADSLFTEVL
jgi:hypothetical protein